MKFENEYDIIYVKDDSYNKEYDNEYHYEINNTHYYKGYLIHRENNYAILHINSEFKEWFINGKRHRIGGVAIEWENPDYWYYINGVEYSKEKYWSIINCMKKKEILESIL